MAVDPEDCAQEAQGRVGDGLPMPGPGEPPRGLRLALYAAYKILPRTPWALVVVLLAFGVLSTAVQPAVGQDGPPGWLRRSWVPRLEIPGGFFCSSVASGGVLLTADHCARKGLEVNYGDGRPREPVLSISCRAFDADFAVLSVQTPEETPRVALGPRPEVGDSVWVAGYPGGRWTIRQASVSRVLRNVMASTPPRIVPELIVANANDPDATPGGISGGAMVDLSGRLVGIVCCSDSAAAVIGAIPIATSTARCPLP